MGKTKFCIGISDISDSYDGMIIDLEGVLHDGRDAYDGVVDCLKELKKRKKFIILLSNTTEMAKDIEKTLKSMGIRSNLYDECISSAQFLHDQLDKKDHAPFDKIEKRCYAYAKESPDFLTDLDVEIVDDIADASFVLLQDFDLTMQKMSDVDKTLRAAVQKRMPAFYINPGSQALMAGNIMMGAHMLAQKYQDFGGVVHFIGKPHKMVFDYCKQIFQAKNIFPGDVVVVGDAMAHDVAGGFFADLDTALVKTGLHKPAFSKSNSPAETDRILNIMIMQNNNVRPTYLVDSFRWGNALPDRKHRKRAQPSR